MAHKVIDRCKETTSTTGTGTLTLTGAATGYVAMADATAGLTTDGDTSWFCAENGAEWELFLGTRVDSTHLARTEVARFDVEGRQRQVGADGQLQRRHAVGSVEFVGGVPYLHDELHGPGCGDG